MASDFAIRHASHQIHHGGVIAYPTETVYGLGCDPMNSEAIQYLNTLKSRDNNKGLILIASNLDQLENFIDVPDIKDQKKITQTDKPTSWIVPAKNNTPDWLTGNTRTLAIRISKHLIVTKLCNQLGTPLVSTSANPYGKKPALNSLQLHKYFHNKVDTILISHNNQCGQPSTLRWLHNDKIARV
jgi:L-threonylcarbamoyladenylate synthase